MKKLPYVTIIIPYKNNLEYLFIALKSIFKQSYKNFKILIVYDDEDKSDLFKIKKFFKNTLFKRKISYKIIVNKHSLGAGYARNVGIKKSNTKYLAFLDSDDIWDKNKLNIQINFMEKNNILFSHTSYHVINSNNKIISSRSARNEIIFKDLIKSCDIGLSTVIVSSSLLGKDKLIFPRIKTKEDYVLWLQIVKKIKTIRGLNIKLTYYRKTKNSLSSDKLLSLINGYKVYRNYMNYGLIKSLFYLFILSINSLKKTIIN
ncbi:glycosyltransferase family A protein [Candidatus Pelagibacter communis]|uniref:glycosyltransferase family A protein n=1 Tax=Pelagibacter ubique TaxID=198252 RepID=UPI00092D0E91|nr:glycosyltransferase family 2 protein [Candidatus Pelagibacter ubique]